jgi:transcriptional regulator with XRE-family HTH domain
MKKRNWLLDYRTKKEMTQFDVARRAGISRTTYAMIETGNRNPSVSVAKRIAKTLGFDWTLFFDNKLHEMCIDCESA